MPINMLLDFQAEALQITSMCSPELDDATVAVERQMNKSKKQRRRVSFDFTRNVEVENDVEKEERKALWYQAKEYLIMKSTTYGLARQIAQTESKKKAPLSWGRVLERSMEVCCSSAKSLRSSEDRMLVNPLSMEERKHLQRWAQVAPGRLGLESLVVRKLGKEKSSRRREMTDTVLKHQRAGDKTESIRRSCERISRSSKLFAYASAQAQHASLQMEA